MFITDKLNESVEFGKLNVEDVFIYKGHCLLKIKDIDKYEGQAFNFIYDDIETLGNDIFVTPRKAKMTLE